MSDADTVYRVITVYDADTSKAKSEIGGFAIVLDHMVNLGREAVGMIKELTGHIIELSAKTETTRIAIAGLFTASGFKGADDFNTSLLMSQSIMQKMIADAAKLPGTMEDLQEIFQGGIAGGSKAGKSIMDIEQLSSKMMAVGKAFEMPAQMIRQEFSEMLEGRARKQTPLFAKLSQFMGDDMTAQKFNAMAAPEKWEKIEAALEKFNPMIKAYGDTWDAVSSTTESYANQLLRIGSSGVFEFMKQKLAEINEWYEKNKDQVDAIAKKLGDELAVKLKQGFEAVKEVVSFIIAHREAIVNIAEAFAVLKGFQILGAGGGFAAGGGKAEAPSMSNVFGGAAFGYALAHLTGETNIVSSSMMMMEGALSQMPGLLGMVSKGLLALHAGLQWVADKILDEQKKDVEKKGDLGDPLSVLGTYDPRRGSIQKDMGDRMASFLEAHNLVNGGKLDQAALRQYLIDSEATGTMDINAVRDFKSLAERSVMGGFLHKHIADAPEFMPGAQGALTPDQKIQQLMTEHGKPVTTHVMTIGTINMYNNIYDSDDPARVLDHLVNKMRDKITHPTQSPSVPNFS
jgi:hypothetical protein